jgi:hypothetical protein
MTINHVFFIFFYFIQTVFIQRTENVTQKKAVKTVFSLWMKRISSTQCG